VASQEAPKVTVAVVAELKGVSGVSATPPRIRVRNLNASCEWLRVLVETGHGQVS
jgi:hypothetical protein